MLALATLIPIGALSWLGMRTLQQDRELERQRRRERLEVAAGRVALGIERQLQTIEERLAAGNGLRLNSRGIESSQALPILYQHLSSPRSPEWSPDGKSLAYSACNGNCLAIRTIDTGEVCKIGRPLLYFREPRWAPDGRSIVVASRDDKGRNGIFQIDVQTGAPTRLIDGPNFGAAPQWSADGKKLYYSIRGQGVLEWDAVSQSSRPIVQRTPLFDEVNLSHDGRFFAARTGNSSAPSASLLLVPVDGGTPRELLRFNQPEHFGGLRTVVWTPDSRALLVTKIVESRAELLFVPIDGQPPHRLDIDPMMWTQGSTGFLDSGFSLSPDGRRIAFLTGKNAAEVWALENFLPSGAVKRP
jgi:Tol biopolymer transport system component